jgi:hypothetical protein
MDATQLSKKKKEKKTWMQHRQQCMDHAYN